MCDLIIYGSRYVTFIYPNNYRYATGFESRMFASPVFIILARLADVIERERLNIETFIDR